MIGPGLFLVTLVVSASVTIFYLIKSRHEENMAKIEHGIVENDDGRGSKVVLNLGIFLCSLGIGLILAYLISTYTMVPDYVSFPASLLLVGGLSLMLSYRIDNR